MNLFNDLAKVVSNISPIVASSLSSPAAALVTNVIGNAVNANPSDVKDIIEKIQSDPSAETKIKDLEYMVNDLKNARDREMAYTNATKQRDWMLPMLAIVIALGFFLTVWAVIFMDGIDPEEKYFMYGLIVGIGVQFAQVYNYYFGKFNDQALTTIASPMVKLYNTIFKPRS